MNRTSLSRAARRPLEGRPGHLATALLALPLLLAQLLAVACDSDAGPTGPDAGLDAGPHASLDAAETAADTEGVDAGDRWQAIAAAVEADRKAAGAPGAAIAILENGRLVFARGFGSKHPDRTDPVKETTLFRIGSITKALTATVLLQQVAEGKVDLEAPITRALPSLRIAKSTETAATVKVKHLLTHTSGIVDATPPEGVADDGMLASYTAGPFAELSFLMAPPGRFYNYSNPNFALAGLTVETIAAAPYRQVMRQRLFAPLGMNRTFFLASEVIADGDYAHARNANPTGPAIAPDSYDNAWARPAGFAFSSVLDLATFAKFLMEGNDAVLPASLRLAMQSPQVDTQELLDQVHYGYGLMIVKGFSLGVGEYYPVGYVGHGGAIPGFSAAMHTIPSQGFALIALANTDGASFDRTLITAIRTVVKLPPRQAPPKVNIDPAGFGRYAGIYNDEHEAGMVTVRKEGDGLTIDIPAADAAGIKYDRKLEPLVDHNFAFRVEGLTLLATFILDASGQPEYLRTRLFVAKRTTTPLPLRRGLRKDHFLRPIRALLTTTTRLPFTADRGR